MSIALVVVGAGGFGREALDVISAINERAAEAVFDVLGVLDANPSDANLERLAARGTPYLGTEADWLRTGTVARFVVGIGSPTVRARVAASFADEGYEAATLVHPMASIGSSVVLGEGTIVCGGVQISTNVRLGAHVQVNPNATIGHDSTIADFVSINPGAIVSGDVTIGAASLIGAGATILQGLAVAENVVVGASACVVRNVAAGSTVKGVPAR